MTTENQHILALKLMGKAFQDMIMEVAIIIVVK